MGSACCKGSDGEGKKRDEVDDTKRSKEPKVEAMMKKTEAADTKLSNAQTAPEKSNDGRQGQDEESYRNESSFRDDGKIPAAITPLTRALNELALHMYTKINSENPNGNVVFSPLSIVLALALTETGASGKTRSEIHKLIGTGDVTQECGRLYGALQEQILNIDKDYGQLRIANAFFGDIGIRFKNAFMKNVKDWFKTEFNQVPFKKDTEKARQRINQWVSDKTAGKIPHLYSKDALNPDSALVLVNAVYLKLDWKTPFCKEFTSEKIFYRFGGKEEQKVQFLGDYGPELIQYAGRKTLQIVELPYKGVDMSMYIVLPRRRDGITDVEKDLTVDRLINLFKSMDSDKGILEMPKFSMRCRMPLLSTFSMMGFQAFDELKQMTDDRVAISDALHEAYIKVDEKGTEATAVTELGGKFMAMHTMTGPPFEFIADHPFLFFIMHKPTWSIVFMGKVNSVENVE